MDLLPDNLPYAILKFFVLIVSLSIHEAAHAWAAWRLGDDTSARLGRLTLNPLAHLDPLGTLMFLLKAPIGWAKPVPVNPANLRNPQTSMPLVAFAGPVSNLMLALIGCAIWSQTYFRMEFFGGWYMFLSLFIATNLSLALFNLIPLFPLDGSKVLSFFLTRDQARRYDEVVNRFGPYPLLFLVVLETLPTMGVIELWFRFWKPFFAPILELFSVPPGFVYYWR